MQQSDEPLDRVSRRGFLRGAGASLAAGGVMGALKNSEGELAPKEAALQSGSDVVTLSFELNGKSVTTRVRTGFTLLETLRDHLDHTGAKLVCDYGSCGACTVLLDSVPVNSCLVLAVECAGRKVETVEGLAKDGKLHPIQQAFIAEDAMQCVFCTPGMIMSCKALLDRKPQPTRQETAEALAGNICRCGTYINIQRAVDRAAKSKSGGR